jgi:hypothetical protein
VTFAVPMRAVCSGKRTFLARRFFSWWRRHVSENPRSKMSSRNAHGSPVLGGFRRLAFPAITNTYRADVRATTKVRNALSVDRAFEVRHLRTHTASTGSSKICCPATTGSNARSPARAPSELVGSSARSSNHGTLRGGSRPRTRSDHLNPITKRGAPAGQQNAPHSNFKR